MRKEGGQEKGEEGRSQDGWMPKAVIHGVSAAKTHMGTRHVGLWGVSCTAQTYSSPACRASLSGLYLQ